MALGGTALGILNVIKDYLEGVSRDKDNGPSSTRGRPRTSTWSSQTCQAAVSGIRWDTRCGPLAGLLVKAARCSPKAL